MTESPQLERDADRRNLRNGPASSAILLGSLSAAVILSFGGYHVGLPADLAGLGLLLCSYGILAHPKVRRNGFLLLVLFAILTVRHIAAVTNSYVATLPTATLDANTFHRQAAALAFGETLAHEHVEFYSRALAVAYRIAGPSHLLGQEVSILAFALSCLVILRMAGRLRIMAHAPVILLIVGLTPSMIAWTSVTMREAFQMLFVLLASEAGLRLREATSLSAVVELGVSVAGMTVLHHGLALYGAVLLAVSIYWAYRRGSRHVSAAAMKRVGGIMLAATLLALWRMLASGVGGAATAVLSGKAIEAVSTLRHNASVLEARTAYGVLVDPSSQLDFIFKLPLMVFYYMAAPFPWQVTTTFDVIVLVENSLRLLLLVLGIRGWRQSRGEERAARGFILLLYAIVEIIWAIGTFNWGTAFRHHVPGFGLLALVGAPSLVKAVRVTVTGLLGSRRTHRVTARTIKPSHHRASARDA